MYAAGIRTIGKPIRRSTKRASIAAGRSSRCSKARRSRGGGGAGPPNPRGPQRDLRQLLFFYVSAHKRGQGLGRQLFQLCLRQAAQDGAAGLYVSSIPQ
ncbi:Uncharacterised protein [Serratia marcescens]|uniref:N-acetyltransferase domain-containing protein n=1 Tax=Serratia marcescens TaxID=615 RepID=A0A379YMG1_SERMA|nr:Uncharacterised protein [Serratia marcescens]